MENKCTREHAQRIEKILESTSKEWLVFFEDALVQFSSEFPIPRTIFYTVDDEATKWFELAIKQVDFSKFSQEEHAFVIRSLGATFLNKFIQVLEPDFQDPFLAIETIFANKFTKLNK